MRLYNFVVERDPETDLLIGYVPGWPGAHSQGVDIDELQANLREVIEMLLEDGEPALESEFVESCRLRPLRRREEIHRCGNWLRRVWLSDAIPPEWREDLKWPAALVLDRPRFV